MCILQILYYVYSYGFRTPISLKLKMATKIDNTALYEELVYKGLKFLPFWNLVSIT
jgi:hypothetical protein